MTPKISIITPVLNGEKYLAECIESVMAQPDVEHVLVDGGSTDGTGEIIQQAILKYGDRILYYHEPGLGIADSWNWGIRNATAPILGWLGYDDLLAPGAIKTVFKFFSEHPDALFVYGECEVINGDGTHHAMYLTEDFDYKRLLNWRCYIACTSAYYYRSIFDRFGMINDFGSDYEMWLRIGKHIHLFHIKDTLSRFRLHETNNSKVNGVKTLRSVYKYSRQHGGSLFSIWAALYWLNVISVKVFQPLKPVLGWAYPPLVWLMRRTFYYSVTSRRAQN